MTTLLQFKNITTAMRHIDNAIGPVNADVRQEMYRNHIHAVNGSDTLYITKSPLELQSIATGLEYPHGMRNHYARHAAPKPNVFQRVINWFKK